jgi:broad specificity phosphatase PhoE
MGIVTLGGGAFVTGNLELLNETINLWYTPNMRTTVYLVRHAEAETNADPLYKGEINGLTETGMKQAECLGSYFKTVHLEKVFTSDVLRARATAEGISKITRKEVVVVKNISERKVKYISSSEYKDEESFQDLETRVLETKNYLENLSDGHFAFVSHAIFLKALIALL